jgi:uncharacterized protein YaiL (DUF2058 family)
MSLLDALQAAGAIDKKAAAKAKREAKQARKKQQGSLEKKKVIEAKAEEAQQRFERERREQRRTERVERESQAASEEAKATAINLIRAWSVNFSCSFDTEIFAFDNRSGEPESVRLPEFLIERVRSGSLGLARIGLEGRIAVLPKGAISKVEEVFPAAILYLANCP